MESHIIGSAAFSSWWPLALTSARPCDSADSSCPPVTWVFSSALRSPGSAAAEADLTISVSEKPPLPVASTIRSTPGSTDGYMAVPPATTGLGRAAGQLADIVVPLYRVVINGPVPPPEKDTVP